MLVIPAIDLINGRCVRLEQGKYDKETVYCGSPVEMAKYWVSCGAKRLHLIDLDGAKSGSMNNFETIKAIRKAINITIDIGGGIRKFDDAKRMFDIGINKVIFGTVAVENKEILKQTCDVFGDKVTVGIDARGGKVAINGWLGETNILAEKLVTELESLGVKEFIYTDIAKDGMMTGCNLEEIRNICKMTKSNVIASGGIASIEDMKHLLELGCSNLIGVITGKALYNKNFELKEAIEIIEGFGNYAD